MNNLNTSFRFPGVVGGCVGGWMQVWVCVQCRTRGTSQNVHVGCQVVFLGIFLFIEWSVLYT